MGTCGRCLWGRGGLDDSPILASLRSRQPGPPRVGSAEGLCCSGDPATLTSAGGRGETAAGASPGGSSTLDPLPISACSVPAPPESLRSSVHPLHPSLCWGARKPLHSTPLPAPPHLLQFICVFLSLATTSSPLSNSAGSL